MNKKIVHDALILMAFSLVLGCALGGVYQITKPAIEAADLAKAQEAYRAVFSNAETFNELEYDVDAANAMMTEKGFSDTIDNVQEAIIGGEVAGHVVTVTAKDGSQGAITLSVGVQADGTVNGYSITAHSETPGLGAKAVEPEFSSQFEGKNVDSFVVVKSAPAADNEIESITGSTITSKAVANACNAAKVYAQSLVGGAQ
ncbi:MAG: RnfABCDGE type electron transport complex subunit G [Lachnospiraceae bacterium]|nr:RnfABCDGE type electron transport complex subunit G [Lachnospiraceae bacterium]